MKVIKNIGYTLYRIWFYILVAAPILILFPLLLLSVLHERWYPFFFRLARIWAIFIVWGMGFAPRVKRQVKYQRSNSYMFIANHTSMTDIMLMLYVVRNPFVFVGKVELAKIPLFGFFYKRTCILVDRGNAKSRHQVFLEAQRRIKQGLSICIFPEGGVSDDPKLVLNEFKDGAFRLAIEHQLPVAPMTFHDNKKRFSYEFFSGGPGMLRVCLHPLLSTNELSLNDKSKLRDQARKVILNELEHPSL